MAYTTDDGVDMSQMINKVLIGAVPYYQATGVYLNSLLERDNSEARDGTDPYTAMEHAWDEAFGYFGAARDYFRYTDDQLAGKVDDFTFKKTTLTAMEASTLNRNTTSGSPETLASAIKADQVWTSHKKFSVLSLLDAQR